MNLRLLFLILLLIINTQSVDAFGDEESKCKQSTIPLIKHRTLAQVIDDNYTGQGDVLREIFIEASPDEKLYYAVAYDDINLAEKVIQEMHANVNYQYGEERISLLQVAVSFEYKDMLQLLLKYHADLELKDKAGNTALHTAAKELYGNAKDYAEILIAAGANPEARNNVGDTPQMVMIKHYPTCAKEFSMALEKR